MIEVNLSSNEQKSITIPPRETVKITNLIRYQLISGQVYFGYTDISSGNPRGFKLKEDDFAIEAESKEIYFRNIGTSTVLLEVLGG